MYNESLSKSIKCNLNYNNITCYNAVTYTAKLYNHTIPNKGSQVIDSPASTFEGLRYREIENGNGKWVQSIQS